MRASWLVLMALLLACHPKVTPPNKRQPLPSPDGKYVLTLPTIRGPTGPLWIVTVSAADGKELYRDADSSFMSTFQVYWAWGEGDRVWLFNSDDGAVWLFEPTGAGWHKERWGHGRVKESQRDLAPPPGLYPPYVKP